MSAECSVCWHDMDYGPEGVPVCGYCEAIDALNTARAENQQLRGALQGLLAATHYIQCPPGQQSVLIHARLAASDALSREER